jgi:hypothetical protein
MAFVVTDPYTVPIATGGMFEPGVVEQGGGFYAVRLRQPAVGDWLEADSLGPYASASEALSHIGELPLTQAPPVVSLGAPE